MTPATTPPVVSVRSASFGYAGRVVVTDLTLQIRAGEVVALLGPNGSGKSTLVRGLLGLNDQLGGTVQVLGETVSRRSDRTRLGYVPQRHTLSGSVRSTVTEVVSTGRLPHRPWWRPARHRDRELVRQALETVGLADRARADVAKLSGGQQRRVLIARALVGEPALLVMDEPTAGVDHASQDVLAQVMARLAGTGVTMLVVTHELTALAGVVDRIVEMDGGSVTFDGTPPGYAAHLEPVMHQAQRHDGHHDDQDDRDDRRAPLLRGPYDAAWSRTGRVG